MHFVYTLRILCIHFATYFIYLKCNDLYIIFTKIFKDEKIETKKVKSVRSVMQCNDLIMSDNVFKNSCRWSECSTM